MKKVIILIMFICLNFGINANNFTQSIRGKVIDQTTRTPIIGVTVVLIGSNPIIGTSTNTEGEFELENVPIGRQSIEFSFIGYHNAYVKNVLLSSGKELNLQIELTEKITSLEEVTIKAFNRKDRALNDMAMISARSFSIEETERFAGSLGDPARMVANFAGVMTQNDARNDIIIRGNSPSGLLWCLDGIEIPNPNHFGALGTTGGPVSMLNNNLLSNSDFITGAFPAEFGNALAGVFDLNMRNGNNSKTEYTGQIGFNGFEAGVEGPLNFIPTNSKSSYIANFRYSTLAIFDLMGFDLGTGAAIPQYKDLTFKLNIPETKVGSFKVIGLLGNSYIELGREFGDTTSNSYNPSGTATNFGSQLGVIGITHTYYTNKNTRINSILSFQSTKSTTKVDSLKKVDNDITEKLFYGGDLKEGKLSFKTSLFYKLSKKNNFELGVILDKYNTIFHDSAYRESYNAFIPITNTEGSLFLYRGYTQWQHKFSNKLTTYTGIYFQHFSLNKENSYEPRASIQWQFNSKQSISAGVGLHSQMQPRTTYFYETNDTANNAVYQTNKQLKFTKSRHVVLGYDYLPSKNLHLKLETYYQYLYNVPIKDSKGWYSLMNSGDGFGVSTDDSLKNKGTGENYGIELTFERFLSKGYYFLFTASVFNSKYVGSDGIERNTAFNGNYVFNLLGGYEYSFNKKLMLTFDIRSVWAGGKRYIPIDLEKSISTNSLSYNFEESYQHKYNDYVRTDFRIGIKLNAPKYTQEWGIDLQNITGYKSIFLETYNVDKEITENVYQQGFFPMFLYRIQF